MPICSAAAAGPGWRASQLPDDERAAIERHVRELDRLGEDLGVLDREIAESALDDPAVKRLLTITGVNLTVAAGLVAAIGDIRRFTEPAEAGELFRAEPAGAPVGPRRCPSWPHQQGRAQPCPRHAGRGGLGGGQGAGPLHAFFVRIRARRGHQIAAVAVARKLAVLCWHLLTKDDGLPLGAAGAGRQQDARAWNCRPASRRRRATSAARPTPTTSRSCATRRCDVAEQAERSYEHFVDAWRPRSPKDEARGRLNPARHE